MKGMDKEIKRIEERQNNLEPPENEIYTHDHTNDCHGLIAGDEDVLWLYENSIWLYRCEMCRSIYYAHKEYPLERTCPYCHFHFNTPLTDYDDLRGAIMAIKELDPYKVKSLQQVIEELEDA